MGLLEGFFDWLGDLFDANADGHVNASDLTTAANRTAEKAFDFVDHNSNGVIELRDFRSMVFNYIDKNGSGHLDSDDFKQILINAFDKNKDGQVTSIDMTIMRLASEIAENYGPAAKVAFLNAAKLL